MMLDLPWILWLLAIILSFWALEYFAFRYPSRENTLSHAVSSMGAKFPLSIAIFGMVIGILLAHWFW